MSNKFLYLYRWDLLVEKVIKKIKAYNKVKLDISYWDNIKGKHKGQAGFVIGNGPSLRIKDLSKIHEKGFVSIASNNIFMAFEKTHWRPDYYTIADPIVWGKLKFRINKNIKTVHIPSYLDYENCNIGVRLWNPLSNNLKKNLDNISDNLSIGAAGGYTVTFENIQLALHLGLNPIYIIGCDHYYAGEENVEEGSEIEYQSGIQNHFINNYIKKGEKTTAGPIKKMTLSYEIARLFSDENNIQIINATRGGYLEAFNRVDTESILS